MSQISEFHLDRIKKGQYMSWFVTTQAANKITVKLLDDHKVYFEASKKSVDIAPPLAQGAAFVENDHLRIQISSSGNKEVKTWHNMSDISSVNGTCVGEAFILSGEDYTDEDYNDVYVSISAWDKAK